MDQNAPFKLTVPAVPVAVTRAYTRDVPTSCSYNMRSFLTRNVIVQTVLIDNSLHAL